MLTLSDASTHEKPFINHIYYPNTGAGFSLTIEKGTLHL